GVGDGVDAARLPAAALQPQLQRPVREAVLQLDARQPLLGAGEDDPAVLHERAGGVLVQGANPENSHGTSLPSAGPPRSPWPAGTPATAPARRTPARRWRTGPAHPLPWPRTA